MPTITPETLGAIFRALSRSTYHNKWIGKWDEDDGTELTESGFKGEFDFG